MNYEEMTQLALRGVVRDALRRVIREDGLPGTHHFYISFLTRFPGVEIDQALIEKYPDEITILLEHQFWELGAFDDYFEVTLRFGGVPKYLKVPYLSLTRFHDPTVPFSIQFDRPENMRMKPAPVSELAPAQTKEPKAEKAKAAPAKKTKTKKKAKPQPKKSTKTKDKVKDKTSAEVTTDDNVVSLDNFRKK